MVNGTLTLLKYLEIKSELRLDIEYWIIVGNLVYVDGIFFAVQSKKIFHWEDENNFVLENITLGFWFLQEVVRKCT